MTEEERRLMGEHVRYAQARFDAGKMLIFGPVMAPDAPFGMGVVVAENEDEVRRFLEEDPSVAAGMNTFEIYPMRVGAARGME